MTSWTTPEDITARVRRRWVDGSLLSAYVAGRPCPVVEVPIRGPSAGEITADLGRVQAWNRALVKGSRAGGAYTLTMRAVGGRAVGRNELPARAAVSTFEQAWRVLGVLPEVGRLDQVVALTEGTDPDLMPWVAEHAARAIELASEWPGVLDAVWWLAGHGGRGLYVRQIEAPGVDTKFVARHRGVIAALLDLTVPADRVAEDASRGDGFARRYGFEEPPRLVRMRFDQGFTGLPGPIGEVALRLDEMARVHVAVQHVVVVENEVTYLSVEVPREGVVIWGAGYYAGRLARVPWVREAPRVSYSGDLDTHGFAILNTLRAGVRQTRSFLMDRPTLLAHRDRWGSESSPTRARLDHLQAAEQALYTDLVEDVYAPSLRLEQERLAWSWVVDAMERDLFD